MSLIKLETTPIVETSDNPHFNHAIYLLERSKKIVIPILLDDIGAINVMEAQTTSSLVKPRPELHQVLASVLINLNAEVEGIIITKEVNDAFYAVLRIRQFDCSVNIDIKISDALCLAITNHVPIYIYDELLDKVGIRLPNAI